MTTDNTSNHDNPDKMDVNGNQGNPDSSSQGNTGNPPRGPSFFERFTQEQILSFWNQCDNLMELAHRLGFTGTELSRADYEYIEKFKTRDVWQKIIQDNRQKERQRPAHFNSLTAPVLQAVLDSPGIETVTHVGIHFLMSGKHARKFVKSQITTLRLNVKPSLHWGVRGVSATPNFYPSSQYVRRRGAKPMICPICNFHAVKPEQMEIHHAHNIPKGTKAQRTPQYYQSPNVTVICRNCHSLERGLRPEHGRSFN